MFELPEYIKSLFTIYKSAGYEIYLVGGAVRNLILGLPVDNWDLTTNATPEQTLSLLPLAFCENKYGTSTMIIEDGNKKIPIEITPYRTESSYSNNRHPDSVSWASNIEMDLSRRDFTINAMAYDGKQIIDIYQGQQHLKDKIIKAVGDPNKRFAEDALRLIRGVRLVAQLGFLIETETRQGIIDNAHLINNISNERIRDELVRILASDYPAEGVLFLRNLGLLKHILPELDVCFSTPQKSPKRHHIYDVGTHAVMALKHCPSKCPIVRLATLLHDVGKPKVYRKDDLTGLITFYNHEIVGGSMVKEIMSRLHFSKDDSDKVFRLVRYHQFTLDEMQTDKAVRRFIRQVGLDNIQAMLDLRTGDRLGSGARESSWRYELFKKRIIEVQQVPFTIKDLKIGGEDVMQIFGLKPSPQVGEILRDIFKQVEKGELKNERESLLERLKEIKLNQSK